MRPRPMHRIRACCLCVAAGCGLWPGQAQETQPAEILIPRAARPVVVDGKGDDPAWQAAPLLHLQALNPAKPISAGTVARLLFDAEHLYALVHCEEPTMDRLILNWPNLEERDSEIWRDDCVELFLDPHARGLRDGTPAIHIVVNTAGVWYDAWEGDRGWNCDLRAAVVKGESSWTV